MNLVMSNTGAEGQMQRRLGFTAGSRGSLVPRPFRGEELGDEAMPRGCTIFLPQTGGEEEEFFLRDVSSKDKRGLKVL